MSSSPPLVVADRYRLVAPLGQGGMGRVWRATDVVLHRDVAIKELVPPPGLTPAERQEMRERSLREARAIARLNNINVVRVFDVLRTDADPWIVMEYVASRSLHDTLASDGPFNPVRAAEIGLGVLNALRAAHRAGVVHRDVKPGNVLLGADGRVVLTDFGLATVPGDPNVTRTGLVLGSPAYIAPERARDGTAGPAADLWSLGATLYAAVEGSSPFARPSAIATLAALATENPPQSRNAGPLKPVLNGLLRKDPTHRINAEEAERLLLRATGRRSKLTFPMSPTMRRPGLGRALPPTGAMPVVPGPRPPVAPSRQGNPPGQPPASGARAAAGDGRPPVFVPGKASVTRPPDKPTRVDGPKVDGSRLDPTRVDGPPVRDGQPPRSTRQAPPPPATPPSRPARTRSGEVDPALARTVRGGPGGFTAADVAAARRKKAAPEHEKSLAEATGHPADATTVVPPPSDRRGPASADATTVVPPSDRRGPSSVDATTVVPPSDRRRPASVDATTVVPAPARPGRKPATPPPADATTVVPPVDVTTVVSPAAGPSSAAPPAEPTTVVKQPGAADPTTVVKHPGTPPPSEPTTIVKHPFVTPPGDATTVVPAPSRSGGKKDNDAAATSPDDAAASRDAAAATSSDDAVRPKTDAERSDVEAGRSGAEAAGLGAEASRSNTAEKRSAVEEAQAAAEAGKRASEAAKATKTAGTTPDDADSGAPKSGGTDSSAPKRGGVEAAARTSGSTDSAASSAAESKAPATKSGAPKSDASESDASESDALNADAPTPDAAKSGVGGPGMGGSGANSGKSDKSDAADKSDSDERSDAAKSQSAGKRKQASAAGQNATVAGLEATKTGTGSADAEEAGAEEASAEEVGAVGLPGDESGKAQAQTGQAEARQADDRQVGDSQADGRRAEDERADAQGDRVGIKRQPGAEPGHAEPGHAEPGHAELGDAELGDAELGDAELGDAELGDAELGDAESADGERAAGERSETESAGSEAVSAGREAADADVKAMTAATGAAESAGTATTGTATTGTTAAGTITAGTTTAGAATAGPATATTTGGKATKAASGGAGSTGSKSGAAATKAASESGGGRAGKSGGRPDRTRALPGDDPSDAIEDFRDEAASDEVALPLARKPRRAAGAGAEPAPTVPANLPPFSPAARPAWKPMQVTPSFRKTAGITVFGTRLTYRQAAIGAAALLVIVVLVIVLAVKAFGGGGDKQAGAPTKPATAGATGGAVQGGGPAKSGNPTKNGAGAVSGKPSVSSSTPSSAPATTASAVTLPAGWKWFNRPTQGDWPGFTIPIPQNASIEPQGSELYIRWNNRLLLVDRTNSPRSDVVQDWKDQERSRHMRDYQKIKIVPVACPFKACADWEFMYTTDNGNAQHADKRNILVSGSAAYSVNWYTTPEDWGPSQSELRLIYQGFQPRP